jgi:co-chaperonin GroES (HSP10)
METVGFTPNQTGVLLKWREAEDDEKASGIIIPEAIREHPEAIREQRQAELNALENGITQVMAVGPDCKLVKVGDWVLLNSPGRLINVEGIAYGLVKEHQIDGVFDNEPNTKKVDEIGVAPGTLKTTKTEKKALDFKEKYDM